jgi:RHS repeat-associated protein
VTDALTGLSYAQQRYYDPLLGRFLSPDPVETDPNSGGNFNRYWYANNNPYRYTDPDGRRARDQDVVQEMAPLDIDSSEASKRTDLRFNPVRGHTALNQADRPGEGRGEFGAPRATARGPSTHSGIDIEAPSGTPVVSVADGVVVDIRPNPSTTYGNQVVVKHADGSYTQYAHLQDITVTPGNPVNSGEQIGTVGRTGNTPRQGDSHLHLERRIGSSLPRISGGTVVDPLPYLPPNE